MAVEKTIIINADSKDAVKNIGQLETKIEELTNKVKSADFGTKEFDEASAELVKYNRQLKNVDLAMESLDTEQMTAAFGGMIGGIAGAATAYTGLAVSLGVSQEAADKNVEKLLALLSITEGVGAVTQGLSDAKKFFNNITKTELVLKAKNIALMVASKVALVASTVATGAVTAAQWLWNAAMTANPIGLIIVGVAALIAGIYLLVANISSVVDWFQEMGLKLLWLAAGPIGWLIFGYQALSDSSKESTDSQSDDLDRLDKKHQETAAEKSARIKKYAKEQNEIREKEIDSINKAEKARKKAFSGQQSLMDLQIDRLEAVGKSSDALKEKKLQNIVDDTKATMKALLQKKALNDAYYKDLRAKMGISEEEFKIKSKSLGIDIDEINKDFGLAFGKLQTELFGQETELLAFQKEIADAEKENAADKKDNKDKSDEEELTAMEEQIRKKLKLTKEEFLQYKKNAAARAKFAAEQKAKEDKLRAEEEAELLEQENAFQEELRQLKEYNAEQARIAAEEQTKKNIASYNINAMMEEDNAKKEAKKIKNRVKSAVNNTKTRKTLEDKLNGFVGSLLNIKDEEAAYIIGKAVSVSKDIAKAISDNHKQQIKDKKDRLNKEADDEQNILKTKLEKGLITRKEFDLESDKLEKSKQRRLKEIERKEFRRQKKISIAKALISGAQSIAKGVAQFGPPPSIPGIAAIVSGTAVTALQVGQIKKQKFTAASGGIVPGANSTVDNVPSLLAGGETVINANSSSLFPGLLNDINQAGGGKDLGTGTSASNQVVKAVVVETDITETQDKINRYKSISEF